MPASRPTNGSLKDIQSIWEEMPSDFSHGKSRECAGVQDCAEMAGTHETLEGTRMNLSTMNAKKHSQPLGKELTALLRQLTDASDTIDRRHKVQQMWTCLGPVFTTVRHRQSDA